MSSHISREIKSRMVRAFSRALAMHCTMELGLSWRKARNSKTARASASPYNDRKRSSSPAVTTEKRREPSFFARHHDQRVPVQPVFVLGLFENGVEIHVENAGRVLR